MVDPQLPDSTPPGDPASEQPSSAEGGVAEAPHPFEARIVDLGRGENERAARRRIAREDFARRGERLLADVPVRFFSLAGGLRDAVNRFNATITETDPHLPLHYEETPGVTLRDLQMSEDLRVSVWRRGGRFDLGLRMLSRAGKPSVPLIEGYGAYGLDNARRVMMRIEGWVEGGRTIYWYSLDFKRMSVDLDELPERIVMSIIQVDAALLHRDLKPPAPAAAPTEQGDDATRS